MKKQRLPIEQLRKAGKIAQEMLVKKGLVAGKSVIDEILKKEGTPMLPGIPAYLPHRWTITASQRIMYDLLIIWKDKAKGKSENLTEFFKFIIAQLREQEKQYKKEMDNMPKIFDSLKNVPVLKDVFSPLRKRENIQAIQRFFIDSFAVAISIKGKHTTSDYANWFLDWTEDMYQLWVNPK